MTNLASDRKAIGASVSDLSGLTAEVAGLLTLGRPYLKADIAQLRRVMKTLNKPSNQAALDEVLNRLPLMLKRQARTGTYGSWYQYYLCDFGGSDHPARRGFAGAQQARHADPEQAEEHLLLQHRREVRSLMARPPKDRSCGWARSASSCCCGRGRGVQPAEVPRLQGHRLPRAAHRRERAAQGQHGPGRRHPGRAGRRDPHRRATTSPSTSTSRTPRWATRPRHRCRC